MEIMEKILSSSGWMKTMFGWNMIIIPNAFVEEVAVADE